MICIGLDTNQKRAVVESATARLDAKKIVVIAPKRFPLVVHGAEAVPFEEAYYYKYFYRLMREIDQRTLLVLNECLRTQNRYDLTYNCIRNFLNQTPHALIFQHLPLIDTIEDFMILFDFETRSRFKRERFTAALLSEAAVHVAPAPPITVRPIHVAIDDRARAAYVREKASLIDEVRSDPEKDPHLIPRNLLLVSGKAKLGAVDPTKRYVGRNNRFKLDYLETYREVAGERPRTVFELPHNFIDLCDMLTITRQTEIDVLVADTKTEAWYLRRYEEWAGRVRDAQAALHR